MSTNRAAYSMTWTHNTEVDAESNPVRFRMELPYLKSTGDETQTADAQAGMKAKWQALFEDAIPDCTFEIVDVFSFDQWGNFLTVI